MVLKICSKIMTETCWWKTHTWIFRKLNTPKVINSKKSCQDKLGKTKEKEKILQAVRSKWHLQANTNLGDSRFLIWTPWQPERSGTLFSRPERKELSTWIYTWENFVEEWKVNNDIFRYRETKRICCWPTYP